MKIKSKSWVVGLFVACGAAKITQAEANAITTESKQLAYCEGVYLYTAQLLQMINNNGAAVNFLSRASKVTTANFFLNKQGDKVTGDRIAEMKSARRGIKERFDSDPELAFKESNECDIITKPIISRAAKQGGTLWGKDFVELNQSTLEQYKSNLGLNN